MNCIIRNAQMSDYDSVVRILNQGQALHINWRPDIYKPNDALLPKAVFEEIVKHITSIPGPFKEQYVKYDDNPYDATIVEFNSEHLKEMRDLVEITYDIVNEMYYSPGDCVYLRKDLYQRLLNKCKTSEDKERIFRVYGFLLEKA